MSFNRELTVVVKQLTWYGYVFFTDAFGRVIFTHLVADTRVIWETRSPTWDQMLVFRDLILWGDVNEIAVNPPTIVIEIFDKDIGVRRTFFLGSVGQSVGRSVGRNFTHRQVFSFCSYGI